ncbi:hypothetical protein M9H77_36166 [Catharanthus roseus]|uniref:Uncharacterized protein n=1 Tax=Catharanthus roseus TaxID=4058 RepID=A0ACB9ZSB9_CATRO|nr:hypothetical protein M9H77_36166 [Catharanthus roseus]
MNFVYFLLYTYIFFSIHNCLYSHIYIYVRGLHCTWLVPRMRASSVGVDDSDSGEWIHLKRGVVPWRAWPNRFTWTTQHALQWDGCLWRARRGLKLRLEAALVSESSETSPSSSYSLREIVPERDPIPVIDLSDSETVEGPVVQGQADSNAGILPEPERVAPVDAEGMDTLVAGGSLQISELREEISSVDAPFSTARQAHRQATARAAILEPELVLKHVRLTTFQSCGRGLRATGADEALEQFFKFRPPEFYGEYRKLGHVRDQCPEMQQLPPETSRRTGRPPAMRGTTEGRSDKPQVKAKVYPLYGLPIDTEKEVVEGDFLRTYDNSGRSISRTSNSREVTDWTLYKFIYLIFLGAMLHIGVAFSKQFIITAKHVSAVHRFFWEDLYGYSSCYDLVFGSIRGLHFTWLVPRTRAFSDGVDNSDLGEWIHLKRGVVMWRSWPNRSTWTPQHALRWDGRLMESQEGLEIKVCPSADLRNGGYQLPMFCHDMG